MENNITIPVTHRRRHWKQAYLNMRGWAFVLAITSILFAIGFAYAITRPRIIQPSVGYEIIPEKP